MTVSPASYCHILDTQRADAVLLHFSFNGLTKDLGNLQRKTSMEPAISLGQLNVRVRPLASTPSRLLDLVPSPEGLLCWLGEGRQIVGWGEATKLEFAGQHAMRDAALQWKQLAASAIVDDSSATSFEASFPIAMASFGFASSTPGQLIVPRVAIVRDGEQTVVVTAALNSEAPDPDEELKHVIQPITAPKGMWTDPGRMTQSQWKAAVRRLITLLKSGAAAKVVLTRDIVVSAALPIDERYLAKRLQDLYPTTWVYAVNGLIGATPEMLAAQKGQQVTSRVLAGTESPEDGDKLLTSLKDRSEHHFAVESVARSLAPMSQELSIPSEPQLLHLPNVTHLATDVTATVTSGNVLDVVDALHPTAAVCGTPTHLAFGILENIEGTQRGRYSGPVGWVDATGSGEFGIALRCGQLSEDRQQIRVFAGGGIMPDSIPEVELAETRAKMKPVLEALKIES